jgi:CxxC-x17-CxxC domain-containing protein
MPGKSKFIPRKNDRKSDRSRSERPEYGRNDRFERKSFGRGPELFDTVCEACGKDTQVPFKPTGGKPVYCRNCFKSEGMPKTERKAGREESGELAEINRKLDRIMRALKID